MMHLMWIRNPCGIAARSVELWDVYRLAHNYTPRELAHIGRIARCSLLFALRDRGRVLEPDGKGGTSAKSALAAGTPAALLS
jgi:hypothetical protein